MIDVVIWLGLPALLGLGVGIGRLSMTAQQRITSVRQERQRWRLFIWQREIEAAEDRCNRCQMH